jgi:hypothetical protein
MLIASHGRSRRSLLGALTSGSSGSPAPIIGEVHHVIA